MRSSPWRGVAKGSPSIATSLVASAYRQYACGFSGAACKEVVDKEGRFGGNLTACHVLQRKEKK